MGGIDMIRKLTQLDNSQLMEYLKEEKAFNLFIIGDIENFGYDSDFQEIWGEFDRQGGIKGVLLRYRHFYVPYAKGEFNVEEFASIIQKDNEFEAMSGKKEIIEKFDKFLEFENKREQFFAELIDISLVDEGLDLSEVKKGDIEDVDSILELRGKIEEFNITPSGNEAFRESLLTGTGRTYFIKESGEAAACASTTAENSESAMIVGVCTHPQYRRKGYATKCMIELCKDILDEGRTLCLFYDNPKAGKIYKNIGFKDIGKWRINSGKK